MKFLFDNESFSFETLRTAGFAAYGGADLGEVLTTASHIGEGDEASWYQAWKATAQRVAEIGEQARTSGHRVSAREALLRASNYYRTAADFLLEHPAIDPEMTLLSAGQRDTFAAAAALFDTPVQDVSIPYEGTTLPAYLFLVDDSGWTPPSPRDPDPTTPHPEERWFGRCDRPFLRRPHHPADRRPGLSAASVAIDPAPFRGVLPLPISSLRSTRAVLGNPANLHRGVPLTYDHFRYAFANAVSEDEAHALYETFAVPASGRAPLRGSQRQPQPLDRGERGHGEPGARPAADRLRREGPHRAVGSPTPPTRGRAGTRPRPPRSSRFPGTATP